jgi:hypothetical protein
LYNSEKISFDVIRKTYEIDHVSKTGRALLKKSEKAFNSNAFQKMSVRLAVQVSNIIGGGFTYNNVCRKSRQIIWRFK